MNISIAILTPGRFGDDDMNVFTSSVDVMRKAMEAAGKFSEYDLLFCNCGDEEGLAEARKDMDSADEKAKAALKLFEELNSKLDDAQKSMIDNFTGNWYTFESSWEAALDSVVKTGEAEQFGDDDMVFPAFGTSSAEARAALAFEDHDEEEVGDWD